MKAELFLKSTVNNLHCLIDESFSYETKMEIINTLKAVLVDIEKAVKIQRIQEGSCPHEDLINATTFADPVGVRKYVCKDCRRKLVFKEGVLEEIL